MIARSTGAAPRHRGRSDGWTFSHTARSSNDTGIKRPYAATMTVSTSTISGRAGWSTGTPSRSATTFAGGGATARPLPAGASGRVSTNAISCRAASRSTTSAPKGAVAATATRATPRLADRGEDRLRSQDRERLLARLVGGALDDERAVEMVELVLRDARRQSFELEPQIGA